MEKLVYLLFDDEERPGSALCETLIDTVTPTLREGGASFISVNVADEDAVGGMVMHQVDPPVRAMVSFWMDNSDDRAPCEAALDAWVRNIAGYLVVESRPLVHETNVGGRTPGVNQVTCITKRSDLDWDDFIRIWHDEHKAVAIETQSTVGYVRNVVVRRLTNDAPEWDGIVEETFPIEALSNPHVFFAAESDEEYEANLGRMVESANRFLDTGPLEVTQMSEYYLG